MNRALCFVLGVALLLFVGGHATAQDAAREQGDVTTAARAFQEGQRAQLQGEHGRAAQLFELAHQSAPAPAALRSAIRNHDAAGNLPRAATLSLQGVEEYADDAETIALTTRVLTRARRELGEVNIFCEAPCSLQVDSAALDTTSSTRFRFFLAPGARSITAVFASGESLREITVEAGSTEAHRFVPPAPLAANDAPSIPAPPSGAGANGAPAMAQGEQGRSQHSGTGEGARASAAPGAEPETSGPFRRPPLRLERQAPRGLSPAVTWVGLGATALLGTATVWSFADTGDASDRYEANPTQANYDDGVARWRRSWILGGVTGSVAIATILVATLGTDWGSDDEGEAAVELRPAIGPGLAGLQLQGTY